MSDYTIRKVIHFDLDPRAESGPIQFGSDWPGVFVRGDHAFYYAACLEHVLGQLEKKDIVDAVSVAALEGLVGLLKSSNIGFGTKP